MQVGDLVKWRGSVAVVVKENRHYVKDGFIDDAPLLRHFSWDILSGDRVVRIARRLPLVSPS
jgi:hypothetical protein